LRAMSFAKLAGILGASASSARARLRPLHFYNRVL
jgi:hypothetical protein